MLTDLIKPITEGVGKWGEEKPQFLTPVIVRTLNRATQYICKKIENEHFVDEIDRFEIPLEFQEEISTMITFAPIIIQRPITKDTLFVDHTIDADGKYISVFHWIADKVLAEKKEAVS